MRAAAQGRDPERDDEQRVRTLSLLVLAFIAGGVALALTATVLLPIIVAAFIAFVVNPLVDTLQLRLKVPRILAITGAFVVVAGGLLGLAGLVTASVAGFASRADFYRARFAELTNRLSEALASVGMDFGELTEKDMTPLFELAQDAATSTVELLGNAALVIILTLYLVAARSPERRLVGVWAEIETTMRSYMAAKLVTSGITGVLTWVILGAFGIDLALAIGVLTFLLNFIPTVGSIIATVLPLPFALVTLDTSVALSMLAILAVVQQLVGNVLEPRMMGEGLDLHPVTILVSLGLWGTIFGIVGMFLSAPLTAVLRIFTARNTVTRPLAEFLAGRLHGTTSRELKSPSADT